jgi:hypothetical protein
MEDKVTGHRATDGRTQGFPPETAFRPDPT